MKLLRLILFIVAAIALFLTGSLMAPSMPLFNFVLLMYTTAVGTWFLYGMNYRVFNRNKIKESLHSLRQVNFQNFMIFHFLLIELPLLLKLISWFQIQLFIALIIMAWLYAFAFVINGKRYKLKKRVLIKNLLIGSTLRDFDDIDLDRVWRAVNIYFASKTGQQTVWTQTWNIATCVVIYVSYLIIYSS